MAYCTSDDVRIAIYGEVNDVDKPTAAQITAIIVDIDNEINMHLQMIGITPSLITNTAALGILKKFSKYGSAGTMGMTLQSLGALVTGVQPDWYYEKYQMFLEDLLVNKGYWTIALTGTANIGGCIASDVTDGVTTTTEADANKLGNSLLG
jgi:hypothetical protein